MNNSLRNFLNKHRRVDAVQRVMRHSKNKDYLSMVLSIEDNADLFQFAGYGDKNPDKIIYHIFLKNRTKSGFFALFNSVLCALVSADKYGFTPVIEYGPDTLYSEDSEILGTKNAFEYYFEQPEGIRPEEARRSARVVEYADRNAFVFGKRKVGYSAGKEDIEKLARVQSKYIRLNETTQEYIMSNVNRMIQGKTLGVHVRGTDYNINQYDHPVSVASSQHIEAVRNAMKNNNFERIFLATDNEDAIAEFKREFGDKVVYYDDTFHSTDGSAVHFSVSSRKNHKYLLGLEVLRDMYTLSYCDGLIAGKSMVSTSVLITKKSRNEEFDYKMIIDNGMNQKGKRVKVR